MASRIVVNAAFAVALALSHAPAALAAMAPGAAGGGTSAAEKKGAEPKRLSEAEQQRQEDLKTATGARKIYLLYLHEGSPYRSLLLAVVTLAVLLVIRKYTTSLMKRYADPRAHKSENVEKFLKTWNTLWKFVIGVFVVIALSGSLKWLGLSAAFLGMMLGWSLQAPVTGIAAWLMIILKRPFKIGDRIIISGIIGDVTDITLTHVVLNQVGGTIGGEEPSGRGVLIPNAILFGQIITNYTLAEEYMLDEVPVRLTFDSDYELAKSIMLDAARKVTADIIAETKQEPFLRSEFFDAGVLVRLRYQSVPVRRQELSSLIVERILVGFQENYPKVRYCYPRSAVRYRWEDDAEGAPEAPPEKA